MPEVIESATAGRANELSAEAAFLAAQGTETAEELAASETPVAPKKVAKVAKLATPTTETPDDDPADASADATSAAADSADDEVADATDPDEEDDTLDPGDDEELEESDTLDPAAAKSDADEFAERLERDGVKIKLDDIKDPVARKFIETRLKDMQSTFTRAMQDARTYRKEEVQLKAEMRFQKDNPVDHFVSLLLADPKLGEQVNARLEEMESPTARRAHDVVVRDAKAQARTAEESAVSEASKWQERGQAVESYAMRAAEKAGVPYELVVADSLVALIESRTRVDASGKVVQQGDVSRADIDRIIKDKGVLYTARVKAAALEERKNYIKQKTADVRAASTRLKPGQGVAPGVGKRTVPKDDDAFVAQFSGE